MPAPKPSNFQALADAWDNPDTFAAELLKYYSDLEASGHRIPADDITTACRTPGAAA
ncbi:hypothetical protein J7E45_16095 [Microbacterium sp. ISL-59]|uniref:hypothetical protein n=1 Tax=Microbacterium sp. ISL-59 TaxID=2819159 RepID=UPI001BEB799F|nr:hypothetical protein [Microbacterium sp. ISL-59]MBT2497134.1 hypothetical protein [Microbacterium sp. ISL-59]